MTGTESILELAAELRSTAPAVRSFASHTKAAKLMEKAAAALEKLAPLDPDIDVNLSDS